MEIKDTIDTRNHHVNATPDGWYAIRILLHYRNLCGMRWVDNSIDGKFPKGSFYDIMNRQQEKRAMELNKAIDILKRELRKIYDPMQTCQAYYNDLSSYSPVSERDYENIDKIIKKEERREEKKEKGIYEIKVEKNVIDALQNHMVKNKRINDEIKHIWNVSYPYPRCSKCGKQLKHSFDKRKINDKLYCKKCYYEELSNVVEKHPIGVPRYDQKI